MTFSVTEVFHYRGFSTKAQNYTLSDCTGEGLKAVLYLQNKWRCATRLGD